MRLRVFWMFLGALLVVATFTFPSWQPIIENRGPVPDEAFPGLAPQLQGDFVNLPQEQQQAYLAFAEEDPAKALAMVNAALTPPTSLDEEQQAMPELSTPITVASGTFQRINAIRWGQGTINIYRDASNALTMRLEDFRVLNGPDLRVYLSAADAPRTSEEMTAGSIEAVDVGSLLATNGNQNYTLPSLDLIQYRSVVVYSQSLELVYTYAPLFVRQ